MFDWKMDIDALFYYRLYLAGRGITTNEAFKWELVEESVDRGELFKIIPVKPSSTTSALEEKKYLKRYNKITKKEEEVEEKKIESFEEIENIYDKGFLGNLKEVFFPPNLG